MSADRIEGIVGLCKRRGFVYPAGEIYAGPRVAWDYGPYGVELKENIRRQWWNAMVRAREDVVGLDSSVIMTSDVWRASGHADAFAETVIDCQVCRRRWRRDELTAAQAGSGARPAGLAGADCPACGAPGALSEPRVLDGLLTTSLGTAGGAAPPPGPVRQQLRPETAQGAFVHFATIMATARRRPPFGVGQVGKVFRNERALGRFLLRTAEFEQMGLEYFVPPGTDDRWQEYWLAQRWDWYRDLGIGEANMRRRERSKEELAHYSKRTVVIEYRFRFDGDEWACTEAVSNRADADLCAHSRDSGTDLSYLDQRSGQRWMPYVISAAAGLDRCVLAFLLDAYAHDEAPSARGGDARRTVMRLDPRLAPVKVAVLPLSRNRELSPRARDLANSLRRRWNVEFDDAGAIGRRYRRQDEIGTPYCVTVDFDTAADLAVTVRERDSMRQQRVGIDQVESYLAAALPGC